jgi:hypothetical protein
MKTLNCFIIVILFSLKITAQAHLGASLADIKEIHPYNTFTTSYTDDGTKYVTTEMPLGVFAYYFDENGLSNMCVQIPSSMVNLNTQVEIYNKKYVITSKTSWTAYLEGGGMMYIKLVYSDENKLYSFIYTSE